MLKKLIIFILLGIVVLISCIAAWEIYQNRPSTIINSLREKDRLCTAFRKIYLKIDLGCLPLGEANLENTGLVSYQNREVYHLLGKAKVSGIVSRFFKAEAEAHSYVDKNKLHPLKFYQVINVPERPSDAKEVFYDQKNNVMELRGTKRQILKDTQDPLSVIFLIQNQNLILGKEYDFNINTNQKNYRLQAKVIRKEEYAFKGQKTGVWVITGDIRRREKSSLHNSTITLWLLDNPYKTPILVKALASGALIVARVVKIE